MSAQLSSRTITTAAATTAMAVGIGAYSIQTAFAETTQNQPPMVFGKTGFTSLRLHSSKTVNHNTKRLVFEFPDKDAKSGLSLTSSLLTISRPQGNWLPVIRPYTPISDFDTPGYVEFLIKKYPSGKASTHLHSLQPGQSLFFFGPLKAYPWAPNKHSHIYLLAGGAGITPMYQLIQGALKNPEDKTKITLVFGVNTEEDLVLREELEGFKRRYPERFETVCTVSDGKSEGEGFEKGRITEELLKKVMKTEGPGENVKVFVCGPPAMETALIGSNGWFGGGKGILGELGYTQDQIFKF